VSDNESLKLIIENQKNFQGQFIEFKKEHREDIAEVKSTINMLGTDLKVGLGKNADELKEHAQQDDVQFNGLRKGQTKISLTMAKLSGIRATILYLVPGVGFIAWLVFKTVFGIVEK
jgi:hypothetical protein